MSNETLADILGLMRSEPLYNPHGDPALVEANKVLKDYADRIEAAHGKKRRKTNMELVKAELANAKQKHPKFVDYFMHDTLIEIQNKLAELRRVLDNRISYGEVGIAVILACELEEAKEAYAKGDYDRARGELAQCAAVCIRGMEYIEAEIEKGGKHGGA
jgi:hypothetical protein